MDVVPVAAHPVVDEVDLVAVHPVVDEVDLVAAHPVAAAEGADSVTLFALVTLTERPPIVRENNDTNDSPMCTKLQT